MKEKDFEAHIEAALTSPESGLTKGTDTYDCATALYRNTLLSFVQETQPKAWKKYTRLVTRNPEEAFIKTFNERCTRDGLLHVLRNGFDAVGARFRVCYFRPESNLNEEHERLYRANKVEVYRQWYYSETCKNSVDMVLVLNGIPVFALELKNQLTGQNIDNARWQWKNDRDPNERCFGFNFRILAYFCVDLDEACMATKLEGRRTYFLPFNQGSAGAGKNGGAGNPAGTDGDFAVSYIWREVFQRDSMMDILHRFMNLESKEEKVRRKNGKEDKVVKKTLIFPRYHQLDVVRKLVAHVKQHGSGCNYLIQHSAGSGKSNSIAWVAHRLSTLFNAENQPIFSSVIVVTDRTVLDAQLRNTISGHDHTRGVIAAIDDEKTSQDLKDAINAGARIIITTLQKFPVIYREVIHYEGRRYGIIIDEAHSSQGGSAAAKMKAALADTRAALEQYAEEEELDAEANDAENKLVQEILSQGKHDNLSFFAFTATPKDTTLQQFCEQGADGKCHPFHVYSMRQAIEEGFILDVLQNYTTYKTCCKLIRTAEENEEMASSKAARLIRQYATLHPENIRQKSEIIVETFLGTTRHKIGGKGKMMVVASSRLAAVLYFRAVKAYAAEQGYADVKPMVAFSGKVEIDDEELTESKLNVRADGTHISEAQTKEEFHNNFNILIVAEKYQTGFDEKLLHTMIVDKKLRSVKCVQTLSRLNRTIYGKEDTYVLDFMNEQDEIKDAFQPFYQETLLEGDLSYDLIYQTKRDLREFDVYHDDDVEKVATGYTRHSEQQEADCAAAITNLLKPVIADYNTKLSVDYQYAFRRKLRALCKWYAHIGQITRLNDLKLHKEYVFARYLIKVLPTKPGEIVDIEGKIEMEYYKLEETGNGSIQLAGTDGVLEPGTTTAGGGNVDKKEPLDELLNRINEDMGGNFTEANKVAARTIMAMLRENTSLAASARSSNMKVFMDTIFKDIFENAALDCYAMSMEGFEDLMRDDIKRKQLREKLAHELYRQFRSEYPDVEENVLMAAEDEE